MELLKKLQAHLKRNYKIIIVRSGITFLVIWAIHTYILAVPAEGFNLYDHSVWYDIVVSREQNYKPYFFWFFASLLFWTIFDGVKQNGLLKYAKQLISTPKVIYQDLRKHKKMNLTIAAFSVGISFIIAPYLGLKNSPLLGLILISSQKSLLGTMLVQLISKTTKVEQRTMMKAIYISGLALVLAYFIKLQLVIGIVITGIGIYLLTNKKVPTSTAMLLLGVFYSLPLFADDGGWVEAGGTLVGWLASEGLVSLAALGIPPAILGAIAAIFGIPTAGAAETSGKSTPKQTTWDNKYTTENIKNLHTDMQQRTYDFINAIEEKLDHRMRINWQSNFRTWEQQAVLRRQKKGTYPGNSWHNYGTGIDLAPIGSDGKVQKLPRSDWEKVWDIAQEHGFDDWGGNWKDQSLRDYGHFAKKYDASTKDLMKEFKEIREKFSKKSDKEIATEIMDRVVEKYKERKRNKNK